MVWHKDSFCHRGKSELFIHELAQEAFDNISGLSITGTPKPEKDVSKPDTL